ncbi:MAG: ABC transporter substrate-binding protein [Acidimicrobiales bacterium]|jgi:ABC-type nitrate/sulfonate/bicarbonate transport system substrate-binding protein
MKIRSTGALALASSLAVGSLAMLSLGGGASAAPVTNVTYAYDFPGPDFELIPLVVAQDQGFFAQAGLNVKVVFPPDTSTTTKLLVTGAANIGFITTTDMGVAVNAGAPVLSIGNYTMSNNWALFAKPGVALSANKLKSELEGKKIFSYGDTWTESMLPFVLKKAGLTDKQVDIVTDPTGQDFKFLLDGKVNIATNTSNYEVAGFDTSGLKGKEPTLLGTAVGAPNIPIWVYATSKSYATSNPTTVSKFMSAVKKGTLWAIANPTKAAVEFDKLYPKSGYTNAYNLDGWKLTIPFLANSAGQYFTQTSAQWATMSKALKSINLISSVPSPSTYYTNKFLP